MFDLLCIVGPTASGKTNLAVRLAAAFGGEIISADSRQVYRGMDIGTGKDLDEYVWEGKKIPYHLIDIVEAGYKYNVFEYQSDFVKVWEDCRQRGVLPVLCGGSGLYVEAVLKGYKLLAVPVDEDLRASLAGLSLPELAARLATYKKLHNTTEIDTPKRAIRAIEIEEYYKTFSDDTRVLNTHKVETVIQEDEKLDDITKTPFNVYLSGIDVYGSIKATSRSDVNVIVTVNPNTKQILLTSTPRDYYVPLTVSNGIPDKLTHAGNYGVEASIDTLQNLYGIDIDYYVKINFSGCVAVVDALGGITIDSEVEFTCGEDASPIPYHFVKGPNECDGEMAVAFSRERHAFAAGDFQRGRNQTAAIKGILQKATSPAILTKYSAVLDAVSDMFLTNIPTSTISDLVKLQLSDSTAWNIQTYSIEGSTQPPAGQGPAYLEITGLRGASVVYPYADSINTAIQLMSKIQNGDVFDVDEYVDSLNNNSN